MNNSSMHLNLWSYARPRPGCHWPAIISLALMMTTPPVMSAQEADPPPPPPAEERQPAAASPAGTRSTPGENASLRLNFRGASLESVLSYLSEAAGFIIVLEAEVRGKVDAWSAQPVTKEEALGILNGALQKNGLAAIRNGRTLTIVTSEEAKKRDLPVRSGANPVEIPKSDEMVTQIVPIRFINAVQLTRDLQPLLSSQATLTANESGNALVITDTQVRIRRLAEIVRALDTSVSSASAIRVFALKYADAKQLATVIKELFPAADSSRTGGNNAARFRNPFAGGNPFGGNEGGERGGGTGSSGTNGRGNASRVVATADEYSNSLVVSGPEDVIPLVEELVASVDIPVEDVTELRVFHLKNADPLELAELLGTLFPDDDRSTENSRSQVRFGGFGPQGGGRTGNNAGNDSDRLRRKGKVLAVADQRTSSIVISAARDLMIQIAQMVDQLDQSPAKRQKVFVYSLENADVHEVEQILRGMFERTTSQANRNNSQQESALTTRSSNGQSTGLGGRQTGTGTGSGLGTGFGNTRSTP
ncbi:MAG: hypothetical protein FJ405_11845 [Verrucomicrobia bacterium]|nr:hypothetical protein [Verrucomicrobiota bacterium]